MGCTSGDTILISLLEAIVDRLADVLERASRDVIVISQDIFQSDREEGVQARPRLPGRSCTASAARRIWSRRSRTACSRCSACPASSPTSSAKDINGKDVRARVKTLSRDVVSLSDHASFQTQKITFLLDATLGMINIQQNAIIKIVSVAAVVFLPPTLVASIYGMNFDLMPELKWMLGYPFAHWPDGHICRASLLVFPPQGLALISSPSPPASEPYPTSIPPRRKGPPQKDPHDRQDMGLRGFHRRQRRSISASRT